MTIMNSYEGVEDLARFSSAQSLSYYRQKCLDEFSAISNFIISFTHKSKNNIVDVGSGNAALLFNLLQQDYLSSAYAIETSHSRTSFGQQWASDCAVKTITFICDSFENINIPPSTIDVFICNSTFHLLGPIDLRLPPLLLKNAYQALSSNGFLVMDIPTHKFKLNQANSGFFSFLRYNNKGSEIVYSVYDLNSSVNSNLVTSTSKYYDQSGSLVSYKTDLFYSYSHGEISSLLCEAGFSNFTIYTNLKKSTDNLDLSDNLYVVAYK